MNHRAVEICLGCLVVWFALCGTARAVYECGGEYDTCQCGRNNFCICDGTCGNCVWHGWHMACCEWARALEWCTDAQYWNDQARQHGYPTGSDPCQKSIFVCEPSSSCSQWGHVGWVTAAYPDGSFDTTEQYWGGPCGTHVRHRNAGFATGGFIYNPDGGCQPAETDDATFVSETVPDGTRVAPGASFVKRWTMRNSGNTTWTPEGNYLWTYDGEERFSAAEQTLLPAGASVAPGATWDWDVHMTAPSQPGTYRGYWRMDRYGVHRFGDRVWVEIVVDAPVDNDGDGSPAGEDCNDNDAAVHPGAEETCNGRDDDCDGESDEGCFVDGGDDGEAFADAGSDGQGLAETGDIVLDTDDGQPEADEAADGGPTADPGEVGGGCGCGTGVRGKETGAAWLALLLVAISLRRRPWPSA